MKIHTNKNWRYFKYQNEVPEDVMKDTFDWMNDSPYHNLDDYTDGFIHYKDNWYNLDDFMPCDQSIFKGWDGYIADSFFSGILIKLSEDGEQYQIGLYLS